MGLVWISAGRHADGWTDNLPVEREVDELVKNEEGARGDAVAEDGKHIVRAGVQVAVDVDVRKVGVRGSGCPHVQLLQEGRQRLVEETLCTALQTDCQPCAGRS
jgi:hypothetical protein